MYCRECVSDRRRARRAIPESVALGELTHKQIEIFWAHATVPNAGACWEWRASIDRKGYGVQTFRGRTFLAHRVAYFIRHGPIPLGLTIDHLCRNRRCVNPRHLEPVTVRENTLRGAAVTAINARKVACVAGHPFTEGNTYLRRDGARTCRTCSAVRCRRYRESKRNT